MAPGPSIRVLSYSAPVSRAAHRASSVWRMMKFWGIVVVPDSARSYLSASDGKLMFLSTYGILVSFAADLFTSG
jgi:hypothetical protein